MDSKIKHKLIKALWVIAETPIEIDCGLKQAALNQLMQFNKESLKNEKRTDN